VLRTLCGLAYPNPAHSYLACLIAGLITPSFNVLFGPIVLQA
jgi:hypothetical protein